MRDDDTAAAACGPVGPAGTAAFSDTAGADGTAEFSGTAGADGTVEFTGGVNRLTRRGDRVHRPAGPWSRTVHALLAHVAASGCTVLPRAHGFDGTGREILDFIPGEVPRDPMPGFVHTDAALRAAARLLRRCHDATAGFVAPAGAVWYRPPRRPAEVICLGDVAPYNTVYRDGLPVAFIDVDTAAPGPRLWDVAYAVYRFVPLFDPGRDPTAPDAAEAARRVRLFVDAYGLAPGARENLAAAVAARLDDLAGFIEEQAAAGHPAFTRHRAEGHPLLYRTDRAYVTARAADLTGAANGPVLWI